MIVLAAMRKQEASAATDGHAVRTQRTRSRILAESLRLFNLHGEPNVATAAIATALGISAGNLHYHFRTKDAIVAELFAAFVARIDLPPAPPAPGPEAIEDLWLDLHLMLEAIWDYRFLYRNLDDVIGRDRRRLQAFRRIVERKHAAVVAMCETLVARGAMRAAPEEIRAIARNVLLVATYWPSFQALRQARAGDEGALGQGAYQVMSLVAPYLVGDARRLLDRLGRSYID